MGPLYALEIKRESWKKKTSRKFFNEKQKQKRKEKRERERGVTERKQLWLERHLSEEKVRFCFGYSGIHRTEATFQNQHLHDDNGDRFSSTIVSCVRVSPVSKNIPPIVPYGAANSF